jgi:hypothetical protein
MIMMPKRSTGSSISDDGVTRFSLQHSTDGAVPAVVAVHVFLTRCAGFANLSGGLAVFDTSTLRNTVQSAFWQMAEMYYRLELKRPAMTAPGMPVTCRWPQLLLQKMDGASEPRVFHKVSTKGANGMLLQ